MLRKIGPILGGLLLSLILANVYYVAFCFGFGVKNDVFLWASFCGCLVAAVATIAFLFRHTWAGPLKPPGGNGPIQS